MNEILAFLRAHSTLTPALVVLAVYLVIAVRKKKLKQESFVDVISTLLAAGSVISGAKLSYTILSPGSKLPDDLEMDQSITVYALIGGGALIWIGIWELIKRFKDLNKP